MSEPPDVAMLRSRNLFNGLFACFCAAAVANSCSSLACQRHSSKVLRVASTGIEMQMSLEIGTQVAIAIAMASRTKTSTPDTHFSFSSEPSCMFYNIVHCTSPTNQCLWLSIDTTPKFVVDQATIKCQVRTVGEVGMVRHVNHYPLVGSNERSKTRFVDRVSLPYQHHIQNRHQHQHTPRQSVHRDNRWDETSRGKGTQMGTRQRQIRMRSQYTHRVVDQHGSKHSPHVIPVLPSGLHTHAKTSVRTHEIR